MKNIDFKTLKQQIKSNSNDNFLVVSAHDRYLLETTVALVRNSFDCEQFVFDLKNLDKDFITESVLSFSFTNEPKLIVINEFSSIFNKNSENESFFKETFADIPEHVIVIGTMYFEDKRSTVSKKLLAFLETVDNCSLIKFEPLTSKLVAKEIISHAKTLNTDIADNLAQLIAEQSLLDINYALKEVEKLSALSGYTEITKQHIDELGIKNIETSVFDMISAIERKNIQKALIVLKDMLDLRVEPLMITGALNTAYVNLYRAKIATKYRKSEGDIFSRFDYKKGDRKVSIAFSRVSGYSLEALKRIIEILMKLDITLKSSNVDKKLILEINIIKLADITN